VNELDVSEKSDGTLWRLSVYHRVPCFVVLREMQIVNLNPHPESDQCKNFITSRGSPLPMPAKFSRFESMYSQIILHIDILTDIVVI